MKSNTQLKPSSKFRVRAVTQVLFGFLFALMLTGVFLSSNVANEQTAQWLQVAIIMLMMSLGLFEIRRFNRELAHLAAIAEAIGRGDFTARARSNAKDSVGLLGTEINKMADRIESSIRENEQSRAELRRSKEALDEQNRQLSIAFTRQSRFGEFLTDLASIDINTLANKSLAHLIAAANAQLGAFFLYDEQSQRLVCLNGQGVDGTALKQITAQNNLDGLLGEVFRQQRWIFVNDLNGSAPEVDLAIGRVKMHCVYGVPLLFRNSVLGVILLAGFKKPEPTAVENLRNHVDTLANALNNALSYKAINRQSVLLERANEELRKADRLRSEFVANMSHELRTPLNSIIGFSGIMLKNKSGALNADDLRRAEKINRNGTHLLHLINDILDLSKIEADRMDLNLTSTRLVPLVQEVIDLLQPQADSRGLQLKLEVLQEEQIVETDDQKLRRVLINLIGNAIKFTHQGCVTVRVEAPDASSGCIFLRVADTGIGITPDKLDTIFEAFRQADNSTTREYGGTGLGLTISRSLVELLGGTLTVESEIGKGSTFSVKLPVRSANLVNASIATLSPQVSREPRTNAPRVISRKSPTGLNGSGTAAPSTLIEECRAVLARSPYLKPGQRVLIVDDDADARDLVSQFVEDLGARPIPCPQATAALRLAAQERPDLITLDLMMPEKNGWEVLSALKAEAATREIPVIIVSIVADRRKAISLGAVDALTKPIIRSEFNASVERILRSGIQKLAKVLIVEDDGDARHLLASWMESVVTELRSAKNGREALSVLETFQPDVIFLDLQMPVMDGQTFLQHLRGDARFATVPVVILTAKSLEPQEKKQLETQVSRILLKGEVFTEQDMHEHRDPVH